MLFESSPHYFHNIKETSKCFALVLSLGLFIFHTQAYARNILSTEKYLTNVNKQLLTQNPIKKIKNSAVLFIAFFNYKSKDCKKMQSIIPVIRKNNPNVNLIFEELPSDPESILMSKAILAAKEQGKYKMLHHAVMAQENAMSLNDIFKIAAPLGINIDALKKSMYSHKIEVEIKKNITIGKMLGIKNTPFFIIDSYHGKSNKSPIIISKVTTARTLQESINSLMPASNQ